ncbi:hypothetical protein PSHT_13257 [Puccinia striiformis]|uniref:Uncharacterized protein n=1 Tax=Puccinia striiformis TaxID=27350 RepID=A0A2S4US19_9BASI|nr:hypothetical protein PSHT_13257 [Puccinia striiformis]
MDDQSVSALDADSSLDLSTLAISTTTPQQETTQPKQTKDEKSRDSKFATLRRLWAVDAGLKSTMSLVKTIRNELARSVIGREAWEEFIQKEAITILSKQAPPKGYYPNGSFQSSATVKDFFFYAHKKETRDAQLTSEHTPFLYNILLATLQNQHGPITRAMEKDAIVNNDIDPTKSLGCGCRSVREAAQWSRTTPQAIPPDCEHSRSIMAFAANRRANALQLTNSVRFLACGVTERVHEYMNYIGLCSSRATAWETLKTLALNAEGNLKIAMAKDPRCPIAPSLCIDNLDIEKKVHDLSGGKRSHTYRGTWGYIHLPDQQLVSTLNSSELTLSAYQEAIRNLDALVIEPWMFLPTA